MQTRPSLSRPAAPRRLLPALAAALAIAPVPARAAPAAAPAEPKPYLLYFGADLDVQQGKEFCRVEGVAGDHLIAQVEGRAESIPTNRGAINLRVQRSLKLASSLVTIANLKSDRIYTPANDPMRKFSREQPGTAGQSDYDLVQGQAVVAATDLALGNPNSPLYPEIKAQAEALQQKANDATVQLLAPANDANENAIRLQQELAKKLFDAVEITFDASSPVPLTRPYLLIVAQYREPDAPPNAVHNWIYARELDPIDRAPRTVTIRKGGFPKGFQLESLQLHLYDHGRELATSVADRRLPLTRDEAFQYTVVDYLSSHKGQNVPASPALYRLPPDLQARVPEAQLSQTYYVKVTKDGLPGSAYTDPDCRAELRDPYLQSVIQEMRFTPELRQGVPIAGVALVKLSHLR